MKQKILNFLSTIFYSLQKFITKAKAIEIPMKLNDNRPACVQQFILFSAQYVL